MSEVSFREQVVKCWAERHRVDDKLAVAYEKQDDHFEELAVAARTDHEHFRRVSIGVHVDEDQRMVDGVDHVVCGDAVSGC